MWPHPFVNGRRDYHFWTRPTKYTLGISLRQKTTTLKILQGLGSSSSQQLRIRNDEENELNNVSIVSIVPGEAWTLSNPLLLFPPQNLHQMDQFTPAAQAPYFFPHLFTQGCHHTTMCENDDVISLSNYCPCQIIVFFFVSFYFLLF